MAIESTVIPVIAIVGRIRDGRMSNNDEKVHWMLRVSSNMGLSPDNLAAEQTEFRVADVGDE